MQFDTPISIGSNFRAQECDLADPFVNAYVPIPAWDVSGNFTESVNVMNQLGICGVPFLAIPECSTKGYVGPLQ
jgi:hypothetical protein